MLKLDKEGPLNILHIASWYPSRQSPQNGNFIQRHIEAIGRLTNSHTLHVVSDSGMKAWKDIEVEQVDNQAVVVLYPKGGFFSRFARSKKAHRIGCQVIKESCPKFDLVHVHVMFPAIAFAKEIADDMGTPMVVTEHATAYHDHHPVSYNWWQKIFLKRYSRSVMKYFPVSDDLRESMIDKGIEGNYQIIPNVVDVDLFQPAETQPEVDVFQFIHISSLKDGHKNVSGLLSVFAEVVDKYPQARLTIIGNAHHEQIQRYINLLELSAKVNLLREVAIQEVAEYLQESHVLVLFSNYENAPCVISEAHCVGLPVVTTDVGGIGKMVDDSNGVLVAPGDIYGMYDALGKVIETYARFDRQAIHEAASKRYAYDEVGRQYLAAYKQVLHRN